MWKTWKTIPCLKTNMISVSMTRSPIPLEPRSRFCMKRCWDWRGRIHTRLKPNCGILCGAWMFDTRSLRIGNIQWELRQRPWVTSPVPVTTRYMKAGDQGEIRNDAGRVRPAAVRRDSGIAWSNFRYSVGGDDAPGSPHQ